MKKFIQLTIIFVLTSLILSSCSRRCGGWYNPKVEVTPMEHCPDVQVVQKELASDEIEL